VGATTPVALQVLTASNVSVYSEEMLKQGRRFCIFNLSARIRGAVESQEPIRLVIEKTTVSFVTASVHGYVHPTKPYIPSRFQLPFAFVLFLTG
jgi:hypothetical protein